MSITVELEEIDFAVVANQEQKSKMFGRVEVLGGDGKNPSPEDVIEELMPKALVKKLHSIMPEDFEISQMKINVEVSGKILGTGLSGNVDVVFSRKAKKKK